jgi:hypothetical protein
LRCSKVSLKSHFSVRAKNLRESGICNFGCRASTSAAASPLLRYLIHFWFRFPRGFVRIFIIQASTLINKDITEQQNYVCNLATREWRRRSLSDKSLSWITNDLLLPKISSAIKPVFVLMKYDCMLKYIFLDVAVYMFFFFNSQHSLPSCLCVNFCPC